MSNPPLPAHGVNLAASAKMVIPPTVGRVVLYYPAGQSPTTGQQPQAATVAYVHSDTCINVSVVNHEGAQRGLCSVELVQDDTDNAPRTGGHARWMPYQKGQAAKADAMADAQRAQIGGGIGTPVSELNKLAG